MILEEVKFKNTLVNNSWCNVELGVDHIKVNFCPLWNITTDPECSSLRSNSAMC